MEGDKRDEHKSSIFLRHSLGLVYTLVIFSIGISTSVYFAMTGDHSQSTHFHEAFFFVVYLTGIGSSIALGAYMWRHRGARYHSQRHQIRMESLSLGHRLAGAAPPPQTLAQVPGSGNAAKTAAPTDVRFEEAGVTSLPFVANCGEGFNAYLRAGLALFVAGTVALDLLHMTAPYLDGNNPVCNGNPFQTVLYACQLLFVVASGALLAFGHRAIFLQHRGLATALMGHLLTACLCLWAHSSVAEITIAVVLARPLGKTNGTATSAALNAAASCPAGRSAIDTLEPFLSPAKVEFALLAGPMTLQLLAYVGDHRMVEAKESAAAEKEACAAESDETAGEGRRRHRSVNNKGEGALRMKNV